METLSSLLSFWEENPPRVTDGFPSQSDNKESAGDLTRMWRHCNSKSSLTFAYFIGQFLANAVDLSEAFRHECVLRRRAGDDAVEDTCRLDAYADGKDMGAIITDASGFLEKGIR